MAIGNSLSGIRFSGIGSGIDTDAIITRLVQLERQPISRLEQQKQLLQVRQSAYQALRSQLQSIASAAAALNSATAFNPVTATSSKAEVATVSAGVGAVAGTYNLAVTRLAQAHKISSGAQTNTTEALNLSGTLVINGRGVTVAATDTLTSIAQKINGADAGVTASLINGGSGQAYLTLTAKDSGAADAIQISNLTGNVATALGLATGATAVRAPITNGFASAVFSSSTTSIGTMLGASGLGPSSFELNGITVNVDLSTMSLTDVAGAINSAGAGVTAAVKSVTENNVTRYQLEIVGNAGTPTYADANGVLEALGVLQDDYTNELIAAQDASYSIDGMGFTSATNTITTVIPGATITLLKGNETTPETTVLSLSQDNTAVKNKIKEFMNAFNGLVDFVRQNSKFDKESFDAGLLFGDSTVQSVEGSIAGQMLATVSGLTSRYSNITQLGFAFDSEGKLKLDEAALDAALAADPAAVGNVFRATGRTSANGLEFVSTSTKTRSSGAVGYSVNVTQAATKHHYKLSIGGGGPLGLVDKLIFNGTLMGGTAYELNFAPGATIDSIVSQINADSKLKELVVASNDGGQLKIESKKYGTPGAFTVATTGTGGEDPGEPRFFIESVATGLDVAGTINGEAATGSGQYLTGNTGNANTEGLQVQVTSASTGFIGNVIVSMGIGAMVNGLVNSQTDSVSGQLTGSDQALQAQIDALSQNITRLEERAVRREQELRRRFTAMEEAIARAQQQGSRLGAILNPA